jgi:hypothetical protein
LHAKLLESTDTCAAFGAAHLGAAWDTDVADSAWIDLVLPDSAAPEFRYDRPVAVTF